MRADLATFIAELHKNRDRGTIYYPSHKVYAMLDAFEAIQAGSAGDVEDWKSLGPSLKATGMTLRQMEAATGVSKSAISRLIRGKPVTVGNFLALKRWVRPALAELNVKLPFTVSQT